MTPVLRATESTVGEIWLVGGVVGRVRAPRSAMGGPGGQSVQARMGIRDALVERGAGDVEGVLLDQLPRGVGGLDVGAPGAAGQQLAGVRGPRPS